MMNGFRDRDIPGSIYRSHAKLYPYDRHDSNTGKTNEASQDANGTEDITYRRCLGCVSAGVTGRTVEAPTAPGTDTGGGRQIRIEVEFKYSKVSVSMPPWVSQSSLERRTMKLFSIRAMISLWFEFFFVGEVK